jgi:hypothetical protein
MAELERKIAVGTENLALAAGGNFDAIARLLDEWRGQLAEMRKKASDCPRPLSKEQIEVLSQPSDLRSRIPAMANRAMLTAGIAQIVKAIRVSRAKVVEGPKGSHRVVRCIIELHEHFGLPSIVCDVAEPHREPAHERLARFVRVTASPVTLRDIKDGLGVSYRGVQTAKKKAVAAGLIREIEQKRGNSSCYAACNRRTTK